MQTDRIHFRQEFQRRLESRPGVALRVSVAPQWDVPVEFTGPQLAARSRELAARYAPASEGSVVLLLMPHSPELFLLHFGLILEGHIPAIIAWPTSRVDPEKYQRNLLHQLQKLPADLLITVPHLADSLRPALAYPTAGCPVEDGQRYERLFPAAPIAGQFAGASAPVSGPRPPADTIFLQFSGGTTGAQKAVPVTVPMLLSQLDLLTGALEIAPDDHVVSWLPMYHDMGLIACLWMPAWVGIPSLHLAANDWVMRPELMLDAITRYRGTLTWLPNFSFSYLAQRRPNMKGPHQLSQVRAWINCSEPVRRRSMLAFAEAFAEWGVQPGALQASYAMAESVFAVSQTRPGRFPAVLSRHHMRANLHSLNTLAFDTVDDVLVSSGALLRDTSVRIVGGDGPCADGVPGEIYIKTPSLFSGYWGSDGFRTHSLTSDGWHATGDYGFIADGELYVVGRIKDIIIVGGQNIFPEDVEAVVNGISGVSPGRVVAFGIEDQDYATETIAVIAEAAGEFPDEQLSVMESDIRKSITAAIGVAPRYVLVVPQRWIVKSTAGKISRRDTREKFLRHLSQSVNAEVA